jgi:hypothetical protein
MRGTELTNERVNIGGIDAEVMSVEDIQKSGAPIMAVPVKMALSLKNYPPGTRSGYPCSICNEDCILAPSGQEVFKAGRNPVICMECFMVKLKQEKDGAV